MEHAYDERTFSSGLTATAGMVATSQTAYFLYIGNTLSAMTIAYIEAYLTAYASGTQTSLEVGLFSSPSAPCKASQVLTELAYTSSFDSLISPSGLGIKRSTYLGAAIPAGTHLWVGWRSQFATTQPTFWGVRDFASGIVLVQPSSATFAATGVSGTYPSPSVPSAGTTSTPSTVCPDMRLTLD